MRYAILCFAALAGPLLLSSTGMPQDPPIPQTEQATKAPSLDEQYYRKQYELAKHQYDSAVEENQQIASLNSKLTLLRLRQQMEYAAKLLSLASEEEADAQRLRVASMELVENDARLAKQQLAWAVEVSAELPGAFAPDRMRELELAAELAELALERAKQADYFDDPLPHLQWQLNRLRSDVLQLQVLMERTESGA